MQKWKFLKDIRLIQSSVKFFLPLLLVLCFSSKPPKPIGQPISYSSSYWIWWVEIFLKCHSIGLLLNHLSFDGMDILCVFLYGLKSILSQNACYVQKWAKIMPIYSILSTLRVSIRLPFCSLTHLKVVILIYSNACSWVITMFHSFLLWQVQKSQMAFVSFLKLWVQKMTTMFYSFFFVIYVIFVNKNSLKFNIFLLRFLWTFGNIATIESTNSWLIELP